MLIGLMSDSHGRHLAVRKAVELFDSLGAERIIHCGDVGGIEVFDEVAGRPFDFVWGNMDEPDDGLIAYLRTLGITPPDEPPVHLGFNGKTAALCHGHEPTFGAALRTLDVDYLFHGHTHVARDEVFRGKRIINPGALFRVPCKTVATLDTYSAELRFHEIQGV